MSRILCDFQACLAYYVYLSAMHRICILSGVIALAGKLMALARYQAKSRDKLVNRSGQFMVS